MHVTGLRHCGQWRGTGLLARMLEAKRQMLRDVVSVLEDPFSCGEDCDPDEPLVLVQRLAVDEVDAVMGAFHVEFNGKAADPGSWSSDAGGMNRWLERYYKEVLQERRPVLIYVHVRYYPHVRHVLE